MRLALLSDGQVYLVHDGGQPQPHTSRFASEAESREQRSRDLHDWKNDSEAWGSQDMMMPGLGPFQQAARPQQSPTKFTNVANGKDNTFCYSMDVYGAGGLFTYNLDEQCETRLMHRNNFAPQGLAANPNDAMLAFGIGNPDGTVNIRLKPADRPQQKQLTSGDTCDEAPCWHRDGDRDYVYFHSTGVGRNQAGYALGRGPGRICRIAVDQGDVETLLDDESFDFLQPRVGPGGELYAIRRKYQLPHQAQQASPATILKDIVLLPYRLFRVMIYFANFMSMMFVGKPIASDLMGTSPEAQAQQRVLWGQAIKTQKRIRKKGQQQRMQLVPDHWEVIRIDDHGQPMTVARHVMAFDIGPAGEVVYSDGGGVYQIKDGHETKLASTPHVTQIAILS